MLSKANVRACVPLRNAPLAHPGQRLHLSVGHWPPDGLRDLGPCPIRTSVRCTEPMAYPTRTLRRPYVTAGLVVALALAGCANGNQHSAGGMMDGNSNLRYSSLACSAPSTLPGRVVRVTLADMGMTSMMGGTAPLGGHMALTIDPASISAGTVSLVASNMGWRTHELVILPLSAGGTAGRLSPGPEGKIDEAGSLGEASNSCLGGSGEGIKATAVGWTTVTLKPGRYELVCNLANHYANGMHQELTVT